MRFHHPLLKSLAFLADVEVYLVGGCVRDWMLGQRLKDLDLLAPGARPERTLRVLRGHFSPKKIERFDQFFTQRWFLRNGLRVDVARPRTEIYPKPGVLPEVSPAQSVEDDLKRRDFTVNAMALGISGAARGRLIDPFGGQEDLKNRRLRVLHELSFQDDPTRLFRLYRFAERLKFRAEPKTAQWAARALRENFIATVSLERGLGEIKKALGEQGWLEALEAFRVNGIASAWIPMPAKKRPLPGLREMGPRALWVAEQESAARPILGDGFQSLPWSRPLRGAMRDVIDLKNFRWSLSRNLHSLAKEYFRAAHHPLAYVFARRRPFYLKGSDLLRLGVARDEVKAAERRLIEGVLCGRVKNRSQAEALFLEPLR
ncbi:MAG: hypothetical protein AAB091_07440 [Elusimicrobiota bacterium]